MKNKLKTIYLDFAAATPVDPRVLKVVNSVANKLWHNPSSLYEEGVFAKKELENLRKDAAILLNCLPDEIVFTSSGTESNNLAIRGVSQKNKTILFLSIDHPSTIETIKSLKDTKGVAVPVDEYGFMDLKTLKENLSKNPVLLSFNYVNGEIGVIENVREIMKAVRFHRKTKNTPFPYVHLDASQAFSVLPIKINELGVDLLTISSDKIYGPKGAALLVIKRGVKIAPIITGGGQENGLRSGTENLPAIAGFVQAMKISDAERGKTNKLLLKIQKRFVELLKKNFKECSLNGPEIGEKRSPQNVSVCFPGIDSEQAVLIMDKLGVKVSFSSSCQTLAERSNSYVVNALGKDNCAFSSLRFSFGNSSKESDLKFVIECLKKAVVDSSNKRLKVL